MAVFIAPTPTRRHDVLVELVSERAVVTTALVKDVKVFGEADQRAIRGAFREYLGTNAPGQWIKFEWEDGPFKEGEDEWIATVAWKKSKPRWRFSHPGGRLTKPATHR